MEQNVPLSYQERYQSSIGSGSSAADAPADRIMTPYRNRLIASDAVMITMAIGIGLLISSRQSEWAIDPTLAIYGTPFLIGVLWLLLLLVRGSYNRRVIGVGSEEVRLALSATLILFAIVAGTSYLIRADISRAYAFVALPLGLLLIAISRFSWRQWLYRKRREGQFLSRILVIGSERTAPLLAEKLDQESFAGYHVVALMNLPVDSLSTSRNLEEWLTAVVDAIDEQGASAVAIDPGDDASYDVIRQLSWRLEGRNIDLLISPGSLDIAGPRLSVRPAAGLPLLHLDEVSLSRSQRAIKRMLDVTGSLIGIVLLSPVMIGCALAVRFTSHGPVVYRQMRVGRGGEIFSMFKFRTMRDRAELEIESLRDQHDLDEPMFKLINDPRVTRVGGFLRRWSLDELPQLFNVLGGSMSLVGPRPHPLDDVDRYQSEAFRRLALKPGMTGIWQVEGRSNLTWDQALQMDLHYVEKWSLESDIYLLAKTTKAVISKSGAA
jgi:exopolysaccharide biosynthesis polyprenyl glycosylphosphotransferase